MTRHLCLWLILGFLIVPARAADSNPPHWDKTDHGAPFVVALARGPRGTVWIGTEDRGVFRYDPSAEPGKEWTQFTRKDGLGDDQVYALAVDTRKRVWVGSLNHGVSVYNGEKWKSYDVLDGPIGERIFALAVCPTDGDVWIGTSAGLSRYSQRNDSWSHFPRGAGLPDSAAGSIAFDPQGNVYLGTLNDGVAMALAADDYRTWTVVRGPDRLPLTATGAGLPSSSVNAVHVDRHGTVWAGTTAGLAWSSDRGKSWRYVRGRDFPDKVRGLFGGAPKDWQQPAAEERQKLLPEDFVTCLAEDGDKLWVGFRRQGLAAVDPRTQQIIFQATKKGNGLPDDFVTRILPSAGQLPLVGTYGGGWTRLDGAVLPQPEPDTPAPLPSPTRPPSLEEVNVLLKWLSKTPPKPERTLFALGDDWRAQGDWMDRHGNFLTILCGVSFATISGYHSRDVTWKYGIGPHCKEGDSVRHWIHWLHTDNPNVLQNPTDGGRRQGEWNDHDDTGYPLNIDGPHVYCTLKLPAGRYVLSGYFFNKDGHAGSNRFRDYLVEVKPTPIDDRDLDGRAHDGAALHALFEKQPAGAVGRVGPSFWGGVYKRFYVEVTEPTVYTIRIKRQHSFNTIISGVFVDALGDPWGTDRQATVRKPRFDGDPGQAAATLDEAARRLLDRLLSLRQTHPAWYAANARPHLLTLIRLLLAKEKDTSRAAQVEKANSYEGLRPDVASCLHDLQLFDRRDSVYFVAGEELYNWQGVTRVGRKWNWDAEKYKKLWKFDREEYERFLQNRAAKTPW